MRTKAWSLESGSGTIVALGLIAMCVCAFAILQIPANQIVEQARAQSAADQAAIAGADSLRGLATGIPCETALLTVIQNHATMSSCRVVGNSVYVSVQTTALIVAEARAGF